MRRNQFFEIFTTLLDEIDPKRELDKLDRYIQVCKRINPSDLDKGVKLWSTDETLVRAHEQVVIERALLDG